MDVSIVIHRILKAEDILVRDWKETCEHFSIEFRWGIYFYTYGKSDIPFYIGKCTAKKYAIIGRVWDEVEYYRKGLCWFPKDVESLTTLEPFKEKFSREDFFDSKIDTEDEDFKKQLERFLKNTNISFAVVKKEGIDKELPESELVHLIHGVELDLQNKLVAKYKLAPGWVGDGGKNFTKVEFGEPIRYRFEYPGLDEHPALERVFT